MASSSVNDTGGGKGWDHVTKTPREALWYLLSLEMFLSSLEIVVKAKYSMAQQERVCVTTFCFETRALKWVKAAYFKTF